MSEKFLEEFTSKTSKNKIKKGCEILLRKYSKLLFDWSKTHNLISTNCDESWINLNIIDSLFGWEFLQFHDDVFDIGSGGGFPAVPLAIVNNEIKFNLVEASSKKCAFLRMVKSKLGLKNLEVRNTRAEKLSGLKFLTTKAAFSPKNISILPKICESGATIAIWTTEKSQSQVSEALEKEGVFVRKKHNYSLDNSDVRYILEMEKY